MSCIGYHNSIHSLYSVSLLQYVEIIVKVYLAENVLLFSDLNQYELFICQQTYTVTISLYAAITDVINKSTR